jgi:hypothetical protein
MVLVRSAMSIAGNVMLDCFLSQFVVHYALSALHFVSGFQTTENGAWGLQNWISVKLYLSFNVGSVLCTVTYSTTISEAFWSRLKYYKRNSRSCGSQTSTNTLTSFPAYHHADGERPTDTWALMPPGSRTSLHLFFLDNIDTGVALSSITVH